ncbi:uncharacterized protein BCR38DRAFT_482904 [Pseudomassariella vexata]|uniref:Chitin-binding type-4 domain-containing protein n=1 Tax=Pseudomassariella vexata TaxID=1141098 RepID=A0A1Y2E6U6_9PEZI|nr:uncharacterized protein BCR38DRAFT_482904 [Pseudomassariella vexata]ORY67281.1 hypothetical protein BCR38DRAFT_482904 [Pseudomassariella vexata]
MKSQSLIAGAALLVAGASAHGNITSPPARIPGPAMAAACGDAAVANVEADGTIPLENVLPTGASCQLDLCRGATFADNAAQVQTFTPGQVVAMTVDIPIPHEGPMNVSIVDTKTNTVVGGPLIEFESYADEALAVLPANNTAFSVTMPTDLAAGTCAVAGDCVLQWFWFGTGAKQTYESCVDFVMGNATATASCDASSARVRRRYVA